MRPACTLATSVTLAGGIGRGIALRLAAEGAAVVVAEFDPALGADCVAKEMTDEHHAELAYLLKSAGFEGDDTKEYTRYGSARSLYHFHIDNASSY